MKKPIQEDYENIPTPPPPAVPPRSRLIQINGLIDETMHQRVISDFLNFELENNNPIYVHINSSGGYVYDMLGILDVFRSSNSPVVTICTGKAMSAAVALLASGKQGERKIGRNATVMLHEVSGVSFGKLYEMDNDIKEHNRLQELYIKILSELTSTNIKSFKKIFDTHKDTYLTPKQVVELKIADKIF